MNNEMLPNFRNKKMNYNNNYNRHNYQINSNNQNYSNIKVSLKTQMMNIPKNMKLNYNNSKIPNNYNYNSKYNNNTFNNFQNYNISDNNTNKIINNKIQRISKPENFSQKNNNNIINENNVMEIQQRFDRLQDKINFLQNEIINKEIPKNLIQEDIIDNNYFNYYQYKPKFNNNTYNSRFNNNDLNNINNSNYPKLKDLNEIHNHMQNVNPRASLIKKITSYRTKHIEESKPNNIIKASNNKFNNKNIKNNRIININEHNIINFNKKVQKEGNFKNNIYINQNDNNNNTYHSKDNIPNSKNTFQFNKKNKISDIHNNNYKRRNLLYYDINKNPHEINQINDLEDFDINNKTFNFGDNNKFKNEFLLENNNCIGNNNYYINKKDINKNNFTANNNNKKKNINNKVMKPNNNKNMANNNRNNSSNCSRKINNNNSNQNKIIDKNENDGESSENLSDIAEEILDIFQDNNLSENYKNSFSNPSREAKIDNNFLIYNTQIKKQRSNDIGIKTKPFKNEINDLEDFNINTKKRNDNNYNKVKESEIGIQNTIISNKDDLLSPSNNIFENKNSLQRKNDININSSSSNNYPVKNYDNTNIINNNNLNALIDNNQKPNIISNNIENNINNNFNNKNYNNINNNDAIKINNDSLMDKKEFVQNINNLNIMKSLIIINNNDVNSKDNQIQSINDIKDTDINLNNLNNNLIGDSLSSNHPNQITNSNIVFNISFNKDNQIMPENKKLENKEQSNNKVIKEEKISEEKNKLNPSNQQNSIIKKLNDESKNKIKEAKMKDNHIIINLDKNIYYHYKIDSCLDDYYEVYNKNDEFINLNRKKKIDLDNYMKILKNSKNLLPSIKKFDKSKIKIKEDYKECENLSEREIIPDLYEEEEEDIRSLEKSLERSIDKSFDKSYDKWYGQSLNDKLNEQNVNESYNTSNSNINDSYSNNNGRKIINQLQEMFIEEVDEEQNEENEKEDILIDEEK